MKRIMLCLLTSICALTTIAQNHGRPEWLRFDDKGKPWSEPEKQNAAPMPLPVLSPQEFQQLTFGETRFRGRGMTVLRGGVASTESIMILKGRTPSDGPARANIAVLPASVIGKLVFINDAETHYCTAQLVGTSGSVVLTAAHCVRDGIGGDWHSRFEFTRAYENGKGEAFRVACVATWSTWPSQASPPNYAVDYAFVKLARSYKEALSLQLNVPADMFIAVGYPKAQNFDDGQRQYVLHGSIRSETNSILEMSPNPMGKGASGGAWIEEGSGESVFSVNSFRVVTERDSVFGPTFDDAVFTLYNFVDQGCPSNAQN